MKQKSIKFNMFINTIRSILLKIFPLITFPYVSRILLTEGIGKYDFAISFVSYFQVIASLGIFTYAVREGAKIREDKEKITVFSNEILLLNSITTIVTYILFFFVAQLGLFDAYRSLIFIYSFTILFKVIGVEWLYSVYEDFTYITIRSFSFQLIALISLFLFVRDSDDVWKYMLITVFSSVGSNVFNYLHARKYVKLFFFKLIYLKGIAKHIKTILVLFGTNIASVVYLHMDSVMLGIFISDSSVGIYSTACKLNNVITALITAVSDVMLPRLSYYLEKGEKAKYNDMVIHVMKYFIFAIVPVVMGCWLISYNIITIFCGIEFYSAGLTMRIMLLDLFFSLLNGFIAYQVCVPNGKERSVLKATTFGAVINLGANMFMIPLWAQNGAALATVFSEFSVFLCLIISSKKDVVYSDIFKDIWQNIICSFAFILVYYWVDKYLSSILIITFTTIILGGLMYLICLLFLKNSTVVFFSSEIKNRLKRRWKR